MFIVYFETSVHAEIIGVMNQDVYDDIYPVLDEWAKKNRGFITESLCEPDDMDQKDTAIGYLNEYFKKSEDSVMPDGLREGLENWLSDCPLAEFTSIDSVQDDGNVYVVTVSLAVEKEDQQ